MENEQEIERSGESQKTRGSRRRLFFPFNALCVEQEQMMNANPLQERFDSCLLFLSKRAREHKRLK